MPSHHEPYTLTEMQRHLYVILVAEAKTAAREERPIDRMSTTRLAKRLKPARDRSNTAKALDSLQGKLPCIPNREFKLRSEKVGHELVYWAVRKTDRRKLIPEITDHEWPEDTELPPPLMTDL
jgi:hypothetical protein